MTPIFRMYFEGEIVLKTPVRIGTGTSTAVTQTDLPVMRDASGLPLIPGSSMKGVIRSYVESVLWVYQDRYAEELAASELSAISLPAELAEKVRGLRKGQRARQLVTDPFDSLERENMGTTNALSNELIKEWKEKSGLTSPELDELLRASSSYTETIFGAPWLASKFYVRDLPLAEHSPIQRTIYRNGVAIDRDRRVQQNKMLYEFEAVPAGARFEFKAVLENAEPEEIGIAALGIRALEKAEIRLGGGSSRGLGIAALEELKIWRLDVEHLADHLFSDDTAERRTEVSMENLRQEYFNVFHRMLLGEQ